MKIKVIFPMLLCIIIGFFMGKFMFSQYDDKEDLKLVTDTGTNLYFFQQGVYSNEESMKQNTMNLPYYIYSIIDNKYYVYVGISKDEKNTEKLKGYFNSLGYNIYVKEIKIDNDAFMVVLDQYEEMLKNTDDDKSIAAIISQVLAKYEEVVIEGEY